MMSNKKTLLRFIVFAVLPSLCKFAIADSIADEAEQRRMQIVSRQHTFIQIDKELNGRKPDDLNGSLSAFVEPPDQIRMLMMVSPGPPEIEDYYFDQGNLFLAIESRGPYTETNGTTSYKTISRYYFKEGRFVKAWAWKGKLLQKLAQEQLAHASELQQKAKLYEKAIRSPMTSVSLDSLSAVAIDPIFPLPYDPPDAKLPKPHNGRFELSWVRAPFPPESGITSPGPLLLKFEGDFPVYFSFGNNASCAPASPRRKSLASADCGEYRLEVDRNENRLIIKKTLLHPTEAQRGMEFSTLREVPVAANVQVSAR